jgi:hypothetical protein
MIKGALTAGSGFRGPLRAAFFLHPECLLQCHVPLFEDYSEFRPRPDGSQPGLCCVRRIGPFNRPLAISGSERQPTVAPWRTKCKN